MLYRFAFDLRWDIGRRHIAVVVQLLSVLRLDKNNSASCRPNKLAGLAFGA
jgi:hypothetical protein